MSTAIYAYEPQTAVHLPGCPRGQYLSEAKENVRLYSLQGRYIGSLSAGQLRNAMTVSGKDAGKTVQVVKGSGDRKILLTVR